MRKSVVVLAVCIALVGVVWLTLKKTAGAERKSAGGAQPIAPFVLTKTNERPVNSGSEAEAGNWAAIPEVVPCREEPRTQRTPVLISATGAHAYLEQTVAIVDKKPEDMTCRAEWVLHVSKPGEDRFVPAKAYDYRERGITPDNMHGDASLYYSGRVMGWSGDGRRLLATAHVAAYEDWFQSYPLVYDMETGKASSVELDKLFAGRAPEGCDLFYDVRGFTSDNKLVVAAEPFEYVEPKDCFAPSMWIVDPSSNTIQRAASPVQPIIEHLALAPRTNN